MRSRDRASAGRARSRPRPTQRLRDPGGGIGVQVLGEVLVQVGRDPDRAMPQALGLVGRPDEHARQIGQASGHCAGLLTAELATLGMLPLVFAVVRRQRQRWAMSLTHQA